MARSLAPGAGYTCDYEIDQLATMTVNNRVISHVFNQTRAQADHVMPPTYWSELVAEGVLVRFADGKMALANYRDYRFDFNI